MSHILTFDYKTTNKFSSPVTRHSFLLRCIPPELPQQHIISAALTIEPETCYTIRTDGFGNLTQLGMIDTPHDTLSYHASGTVEIDASRRVPSSALPVFRFPSAYTAVSPAMEMVLNNYILPENEYQRAEKLMQLIHEHMNYVPGVTNIKTTAAEAFSIGQGVCQDFAHVFLAFARKSGLCARYANGLKLGIGASHAWCEVWINGIWTGIDPTANKWTDDSYIRLSVGRDYSDCPVERGVFSGSAAQEQTVSMVCSEQ